MFARPSVAAVQVGILMGGARGGHTSRSYCVNANGRINMDSSASPCARPDQSSPRSWSEPVMTSRMYALGNVGPPVTAPVGGVLVKSKRSRLASAAIVGDARRSVCVRLPSVDPIASSFHQPLQEAPVAPGRGIIGLPPLHHRPPHFPPRDETRQRDLYLNRRRLLQVPQLVCARLGVDPSRTCQDLCPVSGLVLPQPN